MHWLAPFEYSPREKKKAPTGLCQPALHDCVEQVQTEVMLPPGLLSLKHHWFKQQTL
jgi:hypothetical protein